MSATLMGEHGAQGLRCIEPDEGLRAVSTRPKTEILPTTYAINIWSALKACMCVKAYIKLLLQFGYLTPCAVDASLQTV